MQGNGGQVALLDSHTFSTVGRDCELKFWYFLATDDDQPTNLELYRKTEEDAVSAYSVSITSCHFFLQYMLFIFVCISVKYNMQFMHVW